MLSAERVTIRPPRRKITAHLFAFVLLFRIIPSTIPWSQRHRNTTTQEHNDATRNRLITRTHPFHAMQLQVIKQWHHTHTNVTLPQPNTHTTPHQRHNAMRPNNHSTPQPNNPTQPTNQRTNEHHQDNDRWPTKAHQPTNTHTRTTTRDRRTQVNRRTQASRRAQASQRPTDRPTDRLNKRTAEQTNATQVTNVCQPTNACQPTNSSTPSIHPSIQPANKLRQTR